MRDWDMRELRKFNMFLLLSKFKNKIEITN